MKARQVPTTNVGNILLHCIHKGVGLSKSYSGLRFFLLIKLPGKFPRTLHKPLDHVDEVPLVLDPARELLARKLHLVRLWPVPRPDHLQEDLPLPLRPERYVLHGELDDHAVLARLDVRRQDAPLVRPRPEPEGRLGHAAGQLPLLYLERPPLELGGRAERGPSGLEVREEVGEGRRVR